MALIELVNLGQRFQKKVILKDISFKIERGEAFALIGPTGSGKTTLIRVMDLLDHPAGGKIYFDGTDVTRSRGNRLAARRRMAYVQQKPIVFSMTVQDNVACGLKWRHRSRESIRGRVDEVLEMVGMADYRERDAKTLSGGETQRIAIARALITDPELLLLDEPTANLDPSSTSKIEEVLERIIRARRTTVLMATHDMSQGQRLAQTMGVLMNGELAQIGTKEEIFEKPLNLKVAGFVGMQNILKGIIHSSEEGIAGIDVKGKLLEAITDYPSGEAVCVCIRPEDVTLSFTKPSSSARNAFEGEIRSIISAGPIANVELDCGFPLVALMTVRSAKEMELGIGKRLYASFKAIAVHVVKT
ncbi:MAG: ABC transporter ATP-binding protein [Dehalococcoidia bacterium]|nr:ABC transporter ATP-binding protein [Dehalococcoidia bacterium]